MSAHITAIDILPPRPISLLADRHRQQYARHLFGRVPVHITLVCPFVDLDQLPEAYPLLREICAETLPAELTLVRYDMLPDPWRLVMRLAPEEPIVDLQMRLRARFAPELSGGESTPPHITVGQFAERSEMEAVYAPLRGLALGQRFEMTHIAVSHGNETSVWRVDRQLPLGQGAEPSRG